METSDVLASPVAMVSAALFGALWGSFFNVCIARIPLRQSVVRPGSHCFSCGKPLRAWDNIPVLSYILLRGRCRSCGARFSPRYMLVEALTAGLAALLYWEFVVGQPGEPVAIRVARFAVYFLFTGVLIVLAFIDLDTKRLPDVITLPAIPVLFLACFATHDVPWLERAIGAAAGYGAVFVISEAYYRITGREGLGMGDGKLLAVIGAVLGWRALPPVVFFSSFVGIVVSVPLLLLARRKALSTAQPGEPPHVRRAEVPFGPFLALSALLYLLAAPKLIELAIEVFAV